VGLPTSALAEILRGGAEICRQAGCPVAGGHTVRDEEVKYGLSVTGTVHPDKILRNSTAQPGDVIVLTKPLGTGALIAALKKGRVDAAGYEALITCMTSLNSVGPLLFDQGATACTDVTGFGLSGHALEMARGSGVTLEISTGSLPLLPEAVELCGEGFTCGGTRSNAAYTVQLMEFAPGIGEDMMGLVHDPQTSGGLLVTVPADLADELVAAVLENGALTATRIGTAAEKDPEAPWLRFLA
jgi:selenide,water dikinase